MIAKLAAFLLIYGLAFGQFTPPPSGGSAPAGSNGDVQMKNGSALAAAPLSGKVSDITMRGIAVSLASSATGRPIEVAGFTTTDLVVESFRFRNDNSASVAAIYVASGATVGTMTINGAKVWNPTGVTGWFINCVGTCSAVEVQNADVVNAARFASFQTGKTVFLVRVLNSTYQANNSPSSGIMFEILGTFYTLVYHNINISSASAGIYFGDAFTAGPARVTGSGVNLFSVTTPLRLASSKAISLHSLDFPIARAGLTPLAKDVIVDSTDGPAYYNGSIWKSMIAAF